MTYSDAYSVTAATFDTDAIKRSITPPLTVQTYSGASLDGDIGIAGFYPEQRVSVTTTSSASTFNVNDPIQIRGSRKNGNRVQAFVRLTLIGGNETVETDQPFHLVDTIILPAQLLASGLIMFGVGSVIFEPASVAFEAGAAGTVKVITSTRQNRDLVMPANVIRDVALRGVRRDNATFPVNVYLA